MGEHNVSTWGEQELFRLFDDPAGSWRNKVGRPSAQQKVYEWRELHPDGRPKECECRNRTIEEHRL